MHGDDVALAVANALKTPEAFRWTMLIGGGPRCQIRYDEFVQDIAREVGWMRYLAGLNRPIVRRNIK